VLTRVTRERYEAERAALGAGSPTPAPASEPSEQ
jgi:hypothetical protein